MALFYHDPELRQFENQIANVFTNFFTDLNTAKRGGSVRTGNRSANNGTSWAPALDVYETDKEFVVNAELAGVPKENVNVDVRDNVLHISGETKQDQKYKEGNAHIQERRYGSYSRSVRLPSHVKSDEIVAKFDHGILEVKIPKTESATPKKITIQ
ncbi:11598_t:CDS:2 [Ambispora gerdemannii]|uniref:11598_t:CDS:1 n=1 Tax=Ambispora gerdemannii TaxID=144530 RepID=A0A9N9D7Q9_9GLOM|nr:11598_t:CDS:2 [Ambispora gerdemannii]